MNNKKENTLNIIFLVLGEALVSLIVTLGFFLGDLMFENKFFDFSYRVVTGVVLGSLVTVLNYLFLTISVNRAVNKFMALRGNAKMSDEEAAAFASKNAIGIQNAIKTSFLVRTASIVITLVIAFILDWFAPLATIIPLLAFRPILSITELIKRRFFGAPDPMALMNAITYDAEVFDSVATDITEKPENEATQLPEAEYNIKERDD